MIIIKLAGGASIILATLVFYVEMQSFQKSKIKQLDAFIDLIEYIKNQIECFLLPFDEIICFCDPTLLTDCGINKNMLNSTNMKELISTVNFTFDEAAINVLLQFAEKFGRSYSQEQISSCEYCRNELIKIKEKMLENDAKNQKMRLALSFCISFSIIILLF